MKHLTLALSLAALAGCSSTSGTQQAASPAKPGTETKFTQAATTPLSDLNIVRAPVPAVLWSAQKAPYAVPADASCSALAAEVQLLDAALGADLDTPVTDANPSLIDRGTSAAEDAAVGAVRRTTEGVIPFRGWVRKLTGAERYAKEVSAAIAAGTIRRAYLKGLGQAGGCQVPAAPRKQA